MSKFGEVIRNENLLSVMMMAFALGGTVAYSPIATAQSSISQEMEFNVPAQPLTESLAKFGVQSGLQVSAHGDVVRGLTANAVKGKMTAEQALQQMISGLGLVYETNQDGTIMITSVKAADESKALDAIHVTGAQSIDRHAGNADRSDTIYVTDGDLARRNPTDVKDVFSGEASVSVGGSMPSTQKVYVRGVEESNLAVSVDGGRQLNRTFHHTGNNLIDPSLLKTARIDPSVAPADAGPGALAGSIAYETVDVKDVLEVGKNFGGYATASYDTDSQTFINSDVVYGRYNGLEGLAFFKWGKGDDYSDGDGDQMLGTGTDLRTMLGKAGYESSGGHRFELSVEHVDDDTGRPFRANIGAISGLANNLVRDYILKRTNVVFNYNTENPSDMFNPHVTLGYARAELDVPVPWGSDSETVSISGKIENDFTLSPNNVVTAGVDFYFDANKYTDPSTPEIKEEANNFGAYAQARLRPFEDLSLSFGGRADTQRFTGLDGSEETNSGLSGNASVSYDIVKGLTVSAGYSNVFGGIRLAEAFIFNPGWDYSADSVDPTRAQNVTMGLDGTYQAFSYGGSVFLSDFENARRAHYTIGPARKYDFMTQGYELYGRYDWKSGFVRASFTDSQISIDDGLDPDSDNTQYLGAPLGRIFAIEAEHSFDNTGLAIGGSIDAALENSKTNVDGYISLDLYAEYQPAGYEFLTFRVEANNITDATYADRATYGQEFPTVKPLYEPGRSFLIYMKAEF